MPPKTPASPSRSRLESRKAPQLLALPLDLAICPSSMSAKTKAVTMRTPCHSQPRGKQTSAPNSTPTVPMIVTTSGETPHLLSSRAGGAMIAAQAPRNRSSTSDPPCWLGRLAPCPPDDLPGLPEQLRQRLRLPDDR